MLPYRRSQIAVCRGEHADVYGDRSRSPHALKIALLKDAQQGDLRLRRNVADFIQEDRSAICQLKAAQMPLRRSCKSAFLVAEKLGSDQ
jgi:hypothetical protein